MLFRHGISKNDSAHQAQKACEKAPTVDFNFKTTEKLRHSDRNDKRMGQNRRNAHPGAAGNLFVRC